MAKAPSPLLGYNTNVRHKGRVFHIQTEDSGISKPHVITHLFADGGRILKTTRSSYAELVGAPDIQGQVKKLMQDQHKAMFIALRDGQFDALLEEPATTVTGLSGEIQALSVDAKPADATVDDGTIEVDESSFVEDPVQTVAPTPPSFVAVARAMEPAPRALPPLRPAAPTRAATPTPGGRFVAPRAASATTTQNATRESGAFGERWLSERSLDEVILAYLAEELEGQDVT
jgi:hypothetical protein